MIRGKLLAFCHFHDLLVLSNSYVYSSYPASEVVGPSKRTIVGTLPNFNGVIGCVVALGLAFVLRSRFYLELVATILTACTLMTLT